MAFDVPQAVASLEQAHAADRLAHAYLVTGGSRENRAEFVLGVVENLIGRRAESLQEAECEQVSVLRPEAASRLIKVEHVREIERRFHHSSGGSIRFGVFVDADRLNDQAANAFLKTLEEPPAGVVLLLLTGQPEALLPTILSRCIQIRLTAPPPPGSGDPEAEKLRAAVARHFLSQETLSTSMALAGSFSALLKAEKQRGEKESEAQYKEEVKKYRNTSEGDWLKKRESHHKARVAASYLVKRDEYLGVLVAWLGDVLRQVSGCTALSYPQESEVTARVAQQLGEDEIVRRLEVLSELAAQFHTNVSEALAIEVAFLKAFRPPAHAGA